ncbi:MAG: hypothetical protein WA802_10405 [Terracidiphilus sp.]
MKATSVKTTGECENRKQQPGKAAAAQEARKRGRPPRPNPKQIAVVLSHQALSGNLDSAKLLSKMADQKKPTKPAAKRSRGLTYAQQLALDPPWQGDPDPYPDAYLDEDPDPDLDHDPDRDLMPQERESPISPQH